MRITVVEGDLLEQPDADVVINAWNRNFVWPRWMLLAGGVSGQLKKRTGPGPWCELGRHGLLPLGAAVATGAGEWRPNVHLVHVAGLTVAWRATEAGVQACTVNALDVAWSLGASLVAAPLIGAGHGRMSPSRSLEVMEAAVAAHRPVRSGLPVVDLRIVQWDSVAGESRG